MISSMIISYVMAMMFVCRLSVTNYINTDSNTNNVTTNNASSPQLANVDLRRPSRQPQQQYFTVMTAESDTYAAAVALTVIDNSSHVIHASYGKTVWSLYVGSALYKMDHYDHGLDNDGDYDDHDEDNDGGNNCSHNNSRGHSHNRGKGRRRQRSSERISVHLISELNLGIDVMSMYVTEGVVAECLVNGHVILSEVYNNNNSNNGSMNNTPTI